MSNIIIEASRFGNSVRCICELNGTDKCPDNTDHSLCYVPTGYLAGRKPANFPVPAIPQIHQWDFSLWVLLETIPPLTEDEWDREEEAWQEYLDTLDNRL